MDWSLLGATLLRGLAAYVVLVVYIRISGARTLAKMRAYDFVVTIALGSILAAILMTPSASLAQGLLAMALLVALQWVVARASVASRRFSRLIGNPSIELYARGRFDAPALRRARVTEEEVRSAARTAGHADLSRVRAVWLESNGSLSVVDRE